MNLHARNSPERAEYRRYNDMVAAYYYKLDHIILEAVTLNKVGKFLASNDLELDFSYDSCTDTHGLYDPHVSVTAKMYGMPHEFKLAC
jgi:hypothetical protein